MNKRSVLYGYGIVIFLIMIASLYYSSELKEIFKDPESTREVILSFGIYGPLILILLQFVQVIIFVIPGPIFTVAGGYAFGNFWGSMYSIIGILLGSILVFRLGRIYGRPFVEKVVAKKDIAYYDNFFMKKGKLALFIVRTVPIIFSNDAVSFAMSLTSIKMKDYILVSFVGFIPNVVILSMFGNHLSRGKIFPLLILMSVIGMGLLFWTFRDFVKKNKKL